MFNSFLRIALASIGGALFCPGCEASGTSSARAPAAPLNAADLLPYQGPLRTLFDDSIDAEVFGGAGARSVADLRLAERLRASSVVVTVAVVTVTNESASKAGRLELELVPVGKPTRGALAPYFQADEPIRVRVDSGSPGYALLHANQGEVVGKRLNLCWSRFSDGAGVVEHWHALSDTPKTRLAIHQAAALLNLD